MFILKGVCRLIYHATFSNRLKNIKRFGLGAKQLKNWEFSEDFIVYFAYDAHIAESFAECSEETDDETYDSGIVILCVDENSLGDDGILSENGDELLYTGVVKPEKIGIYDLRTREVTKL